MFENLFDNLPEVQLKEKTATMVNILGIEAKEVYITKWFAHILDPNTFNDPSILKNMLEIYNEKLSSEEKIEVHDFSNIEVNTEFSFPDKGNIDILITMDECIIGIENKIHSGLGTNQLKRYSAALENYKATKDKESKNKEKTLSIVKILLTPESNKAKTEAGFIKITYEEIADKLNRHIMKCKENNRASLYLEDFVIYINEYLKGEEELTTKEWYSYLMENYEDLKNIYKQGEIALNNFKKEIEQRIGQMNDSKEIWSIGNTGNGKKEEGFWIQACFLNWNDYNVHYEFIFPAATSKFLIPEELVLNLDIESSEARKALSKIGLKKRNNKITEMTLDPKNISQNLNDLFEVLSKWHKENSKNIDDALKNR